MKTLWLTAVLIASAYNAVAVSILWLEGGQPNWFVWSGCILFSVLIAYESLQELRERELS